MNYSIKDLRGLINSTEFKTFQNEDSRLIRLGEKIYGRRKDLGLTQSELSLKSDIPQNKISQLESGTYGEPGMDILMRLSSSLGIDDSYLFSDDINRKTFEMFNYFLPKIKFDYVGRLQLIKIPYFIDLEIFAKYSRCLTNFEYIRYTYGPFDKKVYSYEKLFFSNESGFKDCKFIALTDDEMMIIDTILETKPVNNGAELKKLSYETYPMKNLGATLGGREGWQKRLVF